MDIHIKIFFDTLDTQKITGMQVVKSDAAKRTGNPYDETIIKKYITGNF